MKKSSTLFLKSVVLLSAIGTILFMAIFPQTEGRAAHLDLVSIYTDPFILYIYFTSIPFFAGLYQAFTLLTLIDKHRAFTQDAVNTLKRMKYLSLSLITFIVGALLYIRIFAQGDDASGPTMLGFIMALAFGVIATAAGLFQKLFQNAVDLKSENDLTV